MTKAPKPPAQSSGKPRTSRRPSLRDQEPSPFTSILERLVDSIAGATAAALVDGEGETVDYAGSIPPFDIKVAAAHWQIVFSEIGDCLGGIRQIIVRARGRSYIVRQIQTRPSYTIVLVVHRSAAFAASHRALHEAHVGLCIEAGFPAPPRSLRWFGVEVEPEPKDRSRPARVRLADQWHPVEVMGSVVGLSQREKGFRVRLPSGAEMMLVRERLGRWFTDERFGD